MRILKEQDKKIKEFLDVKSSIYQDARCVISRNEGGLVCVFKENYQPSKRQREWMQSTLYRTAFKEYGEGNFEIEKGKNNHYYLRAYEKNTDKTDRKVRADKSKSE